MLVERICTLELVKDTFYLPALVVQRRQLQRRCHFGLHDVGDQSVAILHGRGRALQRVVDHAHLLAMTPGTILAVVGGAQVRTVDEFLLHRQAQIQTS